MNLRNSKNYPKSVESKTSYIRITAPENLDVALEGLVRKVLKEQPKADDIYSFAADYFDALLEIRDKSGIEKMSVSEICLFHNDEDAHEMIKLANTFAKREEKPMESKEEFAMVTEEDVKGDNVQTEVNDEAIIEVKDKVQILHEDAQVPSKKESSEEEIVSEVERVVSEEKAKSVEEVSEKQVSEESGTKTESFEVQNDVENVENVESLEEEIKQKLAKLESEIEMESEKTATEAEVESDKEVRNVEEKEEAEPKLEKEESEIEAENKTEEDEDELHVDKQEVTELEGPNTVTEVETKPEEEESLESKIEISNEIEDLEAEIEVRSEVESKDSEVEVEVEVEKTEADLEVEIEGAETEVDAENNEKESSNESEERAIVEKIESTDVKEEETEVKISKDFEELEEVEVAISKTESVEKDELNEGKTEIEVEVSVEVEGGTVTSEVESEAGEAKETAESLEVFKELKTDEEKTELELDVEEEVGVVPDPIKEFVDKEVELRESEEGQVKQNEKSEEEEEAEEEAEQSKSKEKSVEEEKSEAVGTILEKVESVDILEKVLGEKIEVEEEVEVNEQKQEAEEVKEETEKTTQEEPKLDRLNLLEDTAEAKPEDTTTEEVQDVKVEEENIQSQEENDIEVLLDAEQNDEAPESEKGVEKEVVVVEEKKDSIDVPQPQLKSSEELSDATNATTESSKETGSSEEVPFISVEVTTVVETQVNRIGSSTLEENEGLSEEVESEEKASLDLEPEAPSKSDSNFQEKMKLIQAAIVIQKGYRRFKARKTSEQTLKNSSSNCDTNHTQSTHEENTNTNTQNKNGNVESKTGDKEGSSLESDSSVSSSATKINRSDLPKRSFTRSTTRSLLESQSLDSVRKTSLPKTRSLSSSRQGVTDFEIWNTLEKELEAAATKIQSNFRGYRTRKRLKREDAVQITTTTSEASGSSETLNEISYISSHHNTGEFHDTIVLSIHPH